MSSKATREITIVGQGFYVEMSPWADGYVADYDWTAIQADFNEQLSEREPEGVHWGWNGYGPFIYAEWDKDADELRAAFEAAFEAIDFENIAKAHEYAETERHTPVITEDNAGHFHLTDGRDIWTADWFPGDREQAEEALAAWLSGEWEPSESDGFTRERVINH
ncbi:MAG: hypothetical protein KBG77_06200 [Dermatophilaceae bacterium]|jgi:hypothetical protein|nr:hypothetical protein [Dermatophilaceae bacterium]